MLFCLLLLFSEKVPVAEQPKPIIPEGRVAGKTAIFETEHYRCEMVAVTPSEIEPILSKMGVSDREISRQDVQFVFSRTVFFKLKIQNRAQETLVLNPDRAVLGSGRGPVASLLDMATFWPATVPEQNLDREKLARIFARHTVSLEQDESHTQYLAFRAFGGRFPRKIYLELTDLYSGVVPLDIKCAFSIKYRKHS